MRTRNIVAVGTQCAADFLSWVAYANARVLASKPMNGVARADVVCCPSVRAFASIAAPPHSDARQVRESGASSSKKLEHALAQVSANQTRAQLPVRACTHVSLLEAATRWPSIRGSLNWQHRRRQMRRPTRLRAPVQLQPQQSCAHHCHNRMRSTFTKKKNKKKHALIIEPKQQHALRSPTRASTNSRLSRAKASRQAS